MSVSMSRLWGTLEHYSRFGATAAGGVSRPAFSPPDIELRQQFAADCHTLGLPVRIDAAANVICTRPGSDPGLPAIVVGSHLDSVPDGGRYDGPLGVICGLEVLRVLEEQRLTTRHTIQLVSFTGEEATPFGTSTFGSRALAGRLPDLSGNLLADGRTVRQALSDAGGDWAQISTVPATLGPIACYVEAHIEQGARLEQAGLPLAAVSGVCGIHRQRIVFRGAAGHAGTTAMSGRRDALRAAARVILAVAALPADLAGGDPAAAATVGFLEVAPNSPNVIPGQVTLTTDLRTLDPAALEAMAQQAGTEVRRAAEAEGVEADISVTLDQAPIVFDPRLRAIAVSVAAQLGGDHRELASQAGHDAVHVNDLAPSEMFFVRCAGGASHRPDESITKEDAALAAEALLRIVLEVDAAHDFDAPR